MTELDFTKYRFVSHDVETNYNLGIVNLLNVQYIKNVTKQDTFKILFFLSKMVVHMFLHVLAVLKSDEKTCRPNGHLQIHLNMSTIQRFDLGLKNFPTDCPQELKAISDQSKKFSH